VDTKASTFFVGKIKIVLIVNKFGSVAALFATFFRKKWYKKSRAGQISYHSAMKPSKKCHPREGGDPECERKRKFTGFPPSRE